MTDPKPCAHPGCLSRVSHPCEGCGLVWGTEIIEAQAEQIAKLREVLSDLMDVQNGSPLPKYTEDWEEATAAADEILSEAEPKGEGR